ncbi:hypothetical protein V7798_00780 [Rhizobium laguerreae]
MISGTREKTYIAGNLTVEDWENQKRILTIGGSPDSWADAFDNFFLQRLKLRYFRPIEFIQKNGDWRGEGFSMVSLQCALIEFLAATRNGMKYRHLKRGEVLGQFEYTKSGTVFCQFLQDEMPFKRWFDENSAADFYSSVRCALLHEARTKSGWRIWRTGAPAVDTARKIVFCDFLQEAIGAYVDEYGRRLLDDATLQSAFIRKFDDLAT